MRPTLFLATASGGSSVHREYMFGCLGLLRARPDTVGPVIQQGLYVEKNRDILTAKFLASGCTHLLFVDTDIGWRAHDVEALLAAQKEVISGTYFYKDGSGHIIGHDPADEPININPKGAPVTMLVRCAGTVPGGFLLASRGAILKACAAIPDWIYHVPGVGVVPALWQPVFRPQEACTRDDAAFSAHCKEAGIQLWRHPDVVLRHYGEKEF